MNNKPDEFKDKGKFKADKSLGIFRRHYRSQKTPLLPSF